MSLYGPHMNHTASSVAHFLALPAVSAACDVGQGPLSTRWRGRPGSAAAAAVPAANKKIVAARQPERPPIHGAYCYTRGAAAAVQQVPNAYINKL
jgi:hypothetical protein